jgi:cell wall-active antibiotic response 4TMS protein YvqF
VARRNFDRSGLTAGLIFVGLGLLFLLDRLGLLSLAGQYLWPLLLIVLGIVVLLSESNRRRYVRGRDMDVR